GATLAESFGKYPKTFYHLFTNMLAVGESGGVLDVVLQRLSGYIEKAAKLKAKVKSAMVYPVTIIGVACLVIIFMMIFVLPTFANMFKNMGAELPLPTKIVMWMSDMTRQYVTAGGTLSEPLKATPVFPPMVVHMISVGENTGALDAMLSKIADFYDDEVDAAVTALTSLLEPMMIVFLGVVVGGIVVAMY